MAQEKDLKPIPVENSNPLTDKDRLTIHVNCHWQADNTTPTSVGGPRELTFNKSMDGAYTRQTMVGVDEIDLDLGFLANNCSYIYIENNYGQHLTKNPSEEEVAEIEANRLHIGGFPLRAGGNALIPLEPGIVLSLKSTHPSTPIAYTVFPSGN